MAVVLLGLVGVHYAGLSAVLNRWFFDATQRAQMQPASAPTGAVMVLIDEASLQAVAQTYGQRWPWKRDTFAGLVAVLNRAGATKIALDLQFLEPSEDAYLDEMLASYLIASGNVILANGGPGQPLPAVWRDEAEHRVTLGDVQYQADSDGVVRRYDWRSSLARYTGVQKKSLNLFPLLRWYGGLETLPASVRLSARDFVNAALGPAGVLKLIQLRVKDETDPKAVQAALAQITVPASLQQAVEGKVVFVGTNASGTFDQKAIPVSSLEPGVLVHWNAWANAATGSFIAETDQFGPISLEVGLLLAVAGLWGGWGRTRPGIIIAGAFVLGATLIAVSYGLMAINWFFPPATPVLGLAGTAFALSVHQWREEKRRRQGVQQVFGNYVSAKVVEQLVENPEALRLGGEKKELTIYFSDLAGFTDLSESLSPEDLVEVVNCYLTELSEFVLEEKGYLDKYIGDAIMGVFGAPEELENHAFAACRAALRSHHHLKRLSARMQIERGFPLQARIGINSGEVIVGNMGSPKKLNYTVVGDAVNLASRLEGANKAFGTTILLGDRTEELARGKIVTRPVELLRVKGKLKPVQTHELIGLVGETEPALIARANLFTEAYAAYRGRDFEKALKGFQQIELSDAKDELAGIYRERCTLFLNEPPPGDWDGVFVMKSK